MSRNTTDTSASGIAYDVTLGVYCVVFVSVFVFGWLLFRQRSSLLGKIGFFWLFMFASIRLAWAISHISGHSNVTFATGRFAYAVFLCAYSTILFFWVEIIALSKRSSATGLQALWWPCVAVNVGFMVYTIIIVAEFTETPEPAVWAQSSLYNSNIYVIIVMFLVVGLSFCIAGAVLVSKLVKAKSYREGNSVFVCKVSLMTGGCTLCFLLRAIEFCLRPLWGVLLPEQVHYLLGYYIPEVVPIAIFFFVVYQRKEPVVAKPLLIPMLDSLSSRESDIESSVSRNVVSEFSVTISASEPSLIGRNCMGEKYITVYSINVYDADNNLRSTVQHRYSDFLDLHAALERVPDAVSSDMPRLPPKKMFGYLQPAFVESRRIALTEYLRSLLDQRVYSHAKPLCHFLNFRKHVPAAEPEVVFQTTDAKKSFGPSELFVMLRCFRAWKEYSKFSQGPENFNTSIGLWLHASRDYAASSTERTNSFSDVGDADGNAADVPFWTEACTWCGGVSEAIASGEDSSKAELTEPVPALQMEDGVVKGGTLNQLIQYLTSETTLDKEFSDTFLTTYTSFCSPILLLVKLEQRYCVPFPVELEAEERVNERQQWVQSVVRPIQQRVSIVLKWWLENHIDDFDPPTLVAVSKFVARMKTDHHEVTALHSLLTAPRQRRVDDSSIVLFQNTRSSSFSGLSAQQMVSGVLEFDADVVARQLTVMQFRTLARIRSTEFLGLAWSKPKLRHRAPNVLEMIRFFNAIANFVAASVILPEKSNDRLRALRKLLSLANALHSLHNYDGVCAVLAGLNKSSVYRLKFLWGALPRSERAAYDELMGLMASTNSYKAYRAALAATTPPCIPYLGVFLTDLTFIADGNPDFLEGGRVNFSKRRLEYTVIQQVQSFQRVGYQLLVDDVVSKKLEKELQANLDRTDDALYSLSLLREPRNANTSLQLADNIEESLSDGLF